MKKIIASYIVFLFYAVSYGKGGQIPKKFEYSDSIVITGTNKEILFNRASMWVHESFSQQQLRIKIQDKITGVIYGDINMSDGASGYSVTFSLTLNVVDGMCYYVFNTYNNNAGNLNNATPDCCYSEKQWKNIQVWANTETRHMITSLKNKMTSRSPAEEYLTIPLTDTSKSFSQQKNIQQQLPLKSQPVSFFIQAGGAYAPGIFTTSQNSYGGFRHGSYGGSGQNATPQPITMYHFALGIFVPGRVDPFRGFGIDGGFFSFPLRLKETQTVYTTGTAQQVPVTNTTNISGIDLFPNYTLLSKKKKKFNSYGSIGVDLAFTSASNISDMVALKAEYGMGRNGYYLSAFINYTLNNIYGSSSGRSQQSTIIKPLFLGINFSFFPKQNKGTKKIFK